MARKKVKAVKEQVIKDMRKVAVYARQSVFKSDSISIDAQIKRCVKELGDDESYKVYQDSKSGKDVNRREFQKFMEDVKNDEIKKVVIYKLDRLSRSIVDFNNVFSIFEEHNVELVSTEEKLDTSTPMGRAMIAITVVFAQMERETIQQRVEDNYYDRVPAGFYPGGKPPFGYTKVPTKINGKKTSMYQEKESESAVVKEIFEMYKNKEMTLGKIVKYLNTEREPKVLTTRGNNWLSNGVSRILSNPAYTIADTILYEHLVDNNRILEQEDVKRYDGKRSVYQYKEKGKQGITPKKTDNDTHITLAPHKGFIDSQVWVDCQTELGKNKQIKNSGKGSHTWLSGVLRCGYCNYAATVVNPHRSDVKHLTCGGRKNHVCDSIEVKSKIYVADVEEIVEIELLAFLEQRVKELADTNEEITYADNVKLNSLRAEKIAREEKLEKLLDDLLSQDDISDRMKSLMNKKSKVIEAEVDIIDKDIEALKITAVKKNVTKDMVQEAVDNWSVYDFDTKKKVAHSYICKVEVTHEEISVYFN